MVSSTGLDFVGIVGDSPIAGISFEVDVTVFNGSPQSMPNRVITRTKLETYMFFESCLNFNNLTLAWSISISLSFKRISEPLNPSIVNALTS